MVVINPRDAQLLQHIVRHADEVADAITFFGKDKEIYLNNHIYKNACAMALLSMGENATSLSDEFLLQEATLPWKDLKGLRNIFAHAYDSSSFNHELIWDAITTEVPLIRETCAGILHDNGFQLEELDIKSKAITTKPVKGGR